MMQSLFKIVEQQNLALQNLTTKIHKISQRSLEIVEQNKNLQEEYFVVLT